MPQTAHFRSRPFLGAAILLALAACFGLGMPRNVSAGELIVQLEDGLTLRGQMDDRTDQRFLWLRHEQRAMVLAHAIAWTEVTAVWHEGERRSVEQLRQNRQAFASRLTDEQLQAILAAPAASARRAIEPVLHEKVSRPASLHFDAWLDNWDFDAEPDGLLLCIWTLDEHGVAIPAQGMLNVQLTPHLQDHLPGSFRGDAAVRSISEAAAMLRERWTRRVDLAAAKNAQVIRLPFRDLQPEHDRWLAPHARLELQLGVSGVGNLQADGWIRIRR